MIVERMIKRVRSYLTRWKCLGCGKTFTLYPQFALPYKRYVRQDVCRLSGRYISEDEFSYRKAVQVHHMPICYDATAGAADTIDDRVLRHSTLHRWISFLGGLRHTLGQAWQLNRARSPRCQAFRNSDPIPPWKYRSQQRQRTLYACGRLLQADEVFHLLGNSVSLVLRHNQPGRWAGADP